MLVELGGVDRSDPKAREVAHDLALHIASAAPRYVRREDVPDDAIEKERALLTELTRNEGKPENAIEKIVDGPDQRASTRTTCCSSRVSSATPRSRSRALVEGLGADAAVRRFTRVKVGEE